ncbi:MAG: hypothetical protein ABIN97_16280 [Ginsengibacter sp.]
MKKCLLFFLPIPFFVHAQMKLNTYNVGTSFSCITVDSNYNIWAGTNKLGLYLLNKKNNPDAAQFTIASTGNLSTYGIQALAADQYSNVWVGHNGFGGSTSSGGGIEQINMNNASVIKHYLPDRNAECFSFFARDGIATLSSASLSVDKNGTVWSAHKYHDLTVSGTPPEIIGGVIVPGQPAHYIITPGSLSYKFAVQTGFFSKGTWEDYRLGVGTSELPYPQYTCDAPISATPQSRNCYSVASGKNEVWLSVAPYIAKGGQSIPARIVKYNLDGSYSGISYDFAAMGIPPGGIVNGLYVAPNGDVWVTLSAAKGFAVKRKGNWTYVNTGSLSCIFPAGTGMNANAIWGNKLGQVFIGTTKGLIVYRGTGTVTSPNSYTLYTVATHGLISDQILSGVSEKDSIQWITTDKGIMSSTLGRNYPASNNGEDYTTCNNLEINKIENQSNQNLTKRLDYHRYEIETEVCNTNGPNGGNCNAEFVYKLMKSDATIGSTPMPKDFPADIGFFNNVGFLDLTTSAIEAIVLKISASKVPIVYAYGLFANVKNLFSSTKDIPFENSLNYSFDYDLLQLSKNPKEVKSCNEYFLYHPPLSIVLRKKWTKYIGNIWCGGNLESVEYDKIWAYADDKDLSFTNYTTQGHFLSPGKVVRTVVEECGKVKIVTTGTGLNVCGSNILGQLNGKINKIVGPLLFKNVDMRLIEAFKKAR